MADGAYKIGASIERDAGIRIDRAGQNLDKIWADLRIPLTGYEWEEAEAAVNELRAVIDKAKARHEARPPACPTCATSGIPGKVIVNPRWPSGSEPHIDNCPDCS